MNFQLSPNVDRNKIFLVQRSELEEAWNSEFYSPFFLENRSRIKNNLYGLIKLGNITCKITKGETPLWKGDSYQDEGVLFIKSENILENKLDISRHNRISNLVHTRMGRSQLQENDVLFNIVGASIGRACVYHLNEEANINQAVCLIRINKDFHPDWLTIILNSRPYQIYINQLKSGGARDNIDLHQVNSLGACHFLERKT
jgi:type I restriction enzyme, S subunit